MAEPSDGGSTNSPGVVGVHGQTFASSRVRVSSRAVFTVQAKRSPKIRMSGPVMLMTEGRSASGEVSLMTPPNALAASSFCSGLPVRTPSLRTGRMQVTPCGDKETEREDQISASSSIPAVMQGVLDMNLRQLSESAPVWLVCGSLCGENVQPRALSSRT